MEKSKVSSFNRFHCISASDFFFFLFFSFFFGFFLRFSMSKGIRDHPDLFAL